MRSLNLHPSVRTKRSTVAPLEDANQSPPSTKKSSSVTTLSTSFSSPTRKGSPTPDARAQPRSPPQPPLSLLWRLRSHASGPGLAATRPPRAGHRRLIQDPWHVELVFVTLILHRGDQPSAPQHKAMSASRLLAYIRHFLAGLKEPAPITSEELGEPMAVFSQTSC